MIHLNLIKYRILKYKYIYYLLFQNDFNINLVNFLFFLYSSYSNFHHLFIKYHIFINLFNLFQFPLKIYLI